MSKSERGPIRVVVVDDSETARSLLVAILQNAAGIEVVGTGSTGEDAVELARRLRPDVISMDVVMPRMNGLEATQHIMRETPTPIVIVAGTGTWAAQDLTFRALRAGALTVVRKPGLSDPETCDKVVQTIRLMASVPVVHHWRAATEDRPHGAPEVPLAAWEGVAGRDIRVIGIASSTGGPSALAAVLGPLPADFPIPVLVVQHITPSFVVGLAAWLGRETPLRVSVAAHGDIAQPGTVLLAPDGYHMQVNARQVVELSKAPPYKGLRPSANYLFRSMVRPYGPRALGVVLTGMGDDGAEGLEALHQAGGLTLAQDEESCVVYGMPREAAVRNAVDQVLSPAQISLALSEAAARRNAHRTP